MTETVGSGSLILAAPIAVLAGLVSFFSPCVLPLLPGYFSYMTGVGVQDLESTNRGRMLLGSSLFVLGFSVVFVSGGMLFGSIGQELFQYQRQISIVMGVVVIVLGLAFMGFIPLMQREIKVHAVPAVGLGVAPLLGALFGLGWIPCVSPTLGTVLTLANSEGTAARGALLSFIYCLGLGIPFIVAALAFGRFMRAMTWVKQHQRAISVAGGLMLVAVGVLLVTGLYDQMVDNLRGSFGTGSVAI
ncbi:cytochrome c biogenesis CcdA family protein [Aeromicrobium sp. UC242_57]|uniref:cytochrome c biogenesis CcdA family protein n=1 Tax=Aeromicrobium sp. UC242_57 TaxID=3374624 RepID=UPI00379F826E